VDMGAADSGTAQGPDRCARRMRRAGTVAGANDRAGGGAAGEGDQPRRDEGLLAR